MFLLKLSNVNFLKTICKNPVRKLWGYVAIAFNRVDDNRLKLVGPDRLCAEWILKNGGSVAFSLFPDKFVKNYNSLPPENIKVKIITIDASNSSIMKIGFDHLKGCKHIEKIILHNCKHLEEDGLEGLTLVQNTLKYLQVSGLYNISDTGLCSLTVLTNLQTLRIFDMKYVQNLNDIIKELQKSLKNCKIITE